MVSNRMKGCKKITICICILCLFILAGIFIVKKNKEYASVKEVRYEADLGGESARGLYIYDVQNQWFDIEQLKEKYDITEEQVEEMELEGESKYLLVSMKIENSSEKEIVMPLSELTLETLGWCQGIMAELYAVCTPEDMAVQLEGNTIKEVTLPYVMYDFQFPGKMWKNIENEKFYITEYAYPDKKMWEISN